MDIPLDEVIFFDCVTTHPSTGAATDADSTPTFAVYEESTDTDIGVGGNLTKRTSLTGNYRGTFTLSAANGFEVGKWYSIIGSATVNAIAGKAVLKNFRVKAAEPAVGVSKVDVDTIKTQAVTCAAGVTVLASVGTAATSTAQTGDNFARIGAAGAGLTAIGDTRIANLDAAVTTRMATYTQPAGFLAATFPITVASTTNITGGTVTTVTNLTNAPTAGDFTAAMKTSLNAATPAATVSDKTGFKLASDGLAAVTAWTIGITGNITGNLSGSVGSVTGAVGSVTGLTAANLDVPVSTRMATYTQPAGFLAAIFSATVGDATAANQTTIYNNVLTRSSHSAAEVWEVATRVLTAGTNIQLPANGLANVTGWTVAITGNITGTVTTVTNLTNAPTAGDFTAAMKTSLNAATPAVTVSDKAGFRLASTGLDSVVVETGLNARQALSILSSAEGGVLAGAATTTITIAAAGVPATNRITATVDADGNRSAVTLTPPA